MQLARASLSEYRRLARKKKAFANIHASSFDG
jgi:hypothetical protein